MQQTKECVAKELERKPDDCTGLLSSLAEHSALMRESSRQMRVLNEALAQKTEATYAAVAARAKPSPVQPALNSIVVASKDTDDTGEDCWTEDGRRRTVSAYRKIIISCRNEEDSR